jgi:hypothetical protein
MKVLIYSVAFLISSQMVPTQSALVFGIRGNNLKLDVSWWFLPQDYNKQKALGDQSE